jgi:hypothetical protein
MNPRWDLWAVSLFMISMVHIDSHLTPVNNGIPAYKYSEYVSIALTKVWGNQAKIPSTPRLWKWYEEHVLAKGGYGKNIMFLGLQGWDGAIPFYNYDGDQFKCWWIDMIRFFVGWLNDAAVMYGGRQVT